MICPHCKPDETCHEHANHVGAVSRAINALGAAEFAMRQAADALHDLGPGEARIHAAEMSGAATIARQWELKLRRDGEALAGKGEV